MVPFLLTDKKSPNVQKSPNAPNSQFAGDNILQRTTGVTLFDRKKG
jgi:hypothetical protein